MSSINTRRDTASTAAEVLVARNGRRTDLLVTNEDSSIILRVGDSSVVNAGGTATAVGLAIMPGQTLPLISAPKGGSIIASEDWYIVADSGTPAYSVLEFIG